MALGGPEIATSVASQTAREWFTAAELAALALPGLPRDKRSINRRASDEHWASRLDADGALRARKRPGRGGALEFHVSLLPGEAQLELQKRGLAPSAPEPAEDASAAAWKWFEAQSAKVKDEAKRRLEIVQAVETLCAAGSSVTAAVAAVASQRGVGNSTILSWRNLISGTERTDWLPALAPRRKGGGVEAEIDDEIWQLFVSDALRGSQPTLASCYRRVKAIAAERGVSIPHQRTFTRRYKAEVPSDLAIYKRGGPDALKAALPSITRSIEHLRVMEHVNIDGHTFNVFVEPPPGSRKTKPIRPVMVAIQDLRSSKIMAWRIAETECSLVTRLAFADLFRNWGIPRECTLDNGRAFASKWITGGAKSRFRFKVVDEEPTGLLTGLNIKIHWTQPYSGQSKPIERAFRDLDDTISRSPAFEGAYTGKDALSKPHNYRSKVIPWDEFVAHVSAGIAAHNAQEGRSGRDYAGRSFDQVYAEMLSSSPVSVATSEQVRMALLTAEQKRVHRETAEIELYGNRYHAPELSELRGEKVTVRFDPDQL
ncbi:MAG: transposase domain-containing protein, partial [Pseudomonadota bacterium]